MKDLIVSTISCCTFIKMILANNLFLYISSAIYIYIYREAYGMAACFVTLYAGMLFFNRYLATDWLLILAEVIVMAANLAFIIYAVSELMLEYAVNVSQSKNFIHFVIKFHKFFAKCFKCSPKTLKKIDALHAKLERELHKDVDELMYIKKFESKLKNRLALKHGKGGTKVVPSKEDRATAAWDLDNNKPNKISTERINVAVEMFKGKKYNPKKIAVALKKKGFTDEEIQAVLAQL